MSQPAQSTIDNLLTHVYESVLSPDGFRGFVSAFIEVFELKAAIMLTVNADTNEVRGLWMVGMAQEWMQLYMMEYAPEDLLAKHINVSPIATFYASNLDLPQEQTYGSRFYQNWVVPQGVRYASGAIVLREGPWMTQMLLQRGPEQPAFTRDELGLFNLLMPHLQRALQMRQRFAQLLASQHLLTNCVDMIAMPAILLDEFGRVAHCNRAATALLEGRRYLWLENGSLFSRNAATNGALNLEISNALHVGNGQGSAIPGVVLVPRLGQRDLMVLISPMRMADGQGGSGGTSGALLFAFDPEASPPLKAELVRKLFSLTEAEAHLAVALCDGKTLEEISIERGTTVNTVRSQLKSVFGKTGASRQADLVSLILASPAYLLSH